jgi:hypothetical protein
MVGVDRATGGVAGGREKPIPFLERNNPAIATIKITAKIAKPIRIPN